jgi:hypothetical protein
LSEQAKIARIQEDIKESARNQRIGYVAAFISIIIFWMANDFIQHLVVGLVIISALGLSIYYSSKGAKLRAQLKVMRFG